MTHLPLALAGGHAGTAIAIAIAQRAITFHCPLPILAWSHPPPPPPPLQHPTDANITLLRWGILRASDDVFFVVLNSHNLRKKIAVLR